jgi:hypothetical protein
MGRQKLWRICSIVHARAAKKSKLLFSSPSPLCNDAEILNGLAIDLTGVASETEETQWTSGFGNVINSDESDFSWESDSSTGNDTETTQAFSSKKYRSHRRLGQVAAALGK